MSLNGLFPPALSVVVLCFSGRIFTTDGEGLTLEQIEERQDHLAGRRQQTEQLAEEFSMEDFLLAVRSPSLGRGMVTSSQSLCAETASTAPADEQQEFSAYDAGGSFCLTAPSAITTPSDSAASERTRQQSQMRGRQTSLSAGLPPLASSTPIASADHAPEQGRWFRSTSLVWNAQ